ncbi:hypothetical protein [Aliiglaciecola sp. LCG003]|uniref:hypothetical protein n=1 Tax=Aliiglaciecola sp. LCG003 TaxID=3053655 RepID=UPI00257379BE|nr:hypothetical protein [Aliiglaciecola sp. LCG003]WJG09084.1 hypothetical protein QR722_17420 [Aliiglaciecola sp. LCG003]
MSHILVKLSFLSLLVCSFNSFAFVFTISEKQLNTMLNLTFPIVREYQGVQATFSDPMVKLDALDDKVSISSTITAIQNGKVLRAIGTIEGEFGYHPITQQLRFEKPELQSLKIIENQFDGTDEVVRTLKQSIGRNLPIIILVDFNQFNFGFGDIAPKEIDITPLGLSITL